jgi:hypothetical protein
MVPLNASALVILTGNGLTVSEDLARRFIAVEFDPRTEDPEARSFTTDIRAQLGRKVLATAPLRVRCLSNIIVEAANRDGPVLMPLPPNRE